MWSTGMGASHVRARLLNLLGIAVLGAATAGCGRNEPQVIVLNEAALAARPASDSMGADDSDLSPRILRRYAPLPELTSEPVTALVDLGRMLYYEPRLSRTGLVSCNTCHPLDRYGATNTPVSVGVDGKLGSRNAPSTYHAAGHFTQFWDGRAPTLVEQVKQPLVNDVEMGMTSAEVISRLKSIEGYPEAFARAFPGEARPVTFDNVAVAIGAFEQGLITPAASWRTVGS